MNRINLKIRIPGVPNDKSTLAHSGKIVFLTLKPPLFNPFNPYSDTFCYNLSSDCNDDGQLRQTDALLSACCSVKTSQ